MKKKVIIIIFTIILTIQSVFVGTYKIDSNSGKIEKQKASNSVFDENVTLDWSYVTDGDVMPYSLFTPSNADKLEKVPLIVWLHGSGEIAVTESVFRARGLPTVLENWNLDGFSAYVLCPHLSGGWGSTWVNANAKRNLTNVVDKFISEHNVDTNNIIIVGHSLGGQGALYMAYHMSDYFSKAVVLSGYYVQGVELSQITIPTIFYTGKSDDGGCTYSMSTYFEPIFGEDSCFWVDASHGTVPKMSFTEDNGKHVRKWTEMDVLM